MHFSQENCRSQSLTVIFNIKQRTKIPQQLHLQCPLPTITLFHACIYLFHTHTHTDTDTYTDTHTDTAHDKKNNSKVVQLQAYHYNR